MAAWRRVYERCLLVEDIYPKLTRRFVDEPVTTFAELGGGRGPMTAILVELGVRSWVVDLDPQMIAESAGPCVRADLVALPLRDGCVGGASAVNCLYFLDDPRVALREAKRVVRPGGLFVASAPSRFNDPELEGINPEWGAPSPFDSEDAPALVAEVFGEVEVEPWEIVAYRLPDRPAIADYLHAVGVPDHDAAAGTITPPLSITKLGAEVWARA
ncbi:MAG: class I SAM-dependent methyltransferase [Acidimicrobiales bacterium]